MLISYNKEKLEQITNDLFILTGISIAFLDKDFNCICMCTKSNDFCEKIQSYPDSYKKCIDCDRKLLMQSAQSKKFVSHLCHSGLFDAVLPIIQNNQVAGYILMGRVRCSESPNESYLKDEKLKKLFYEIPFFSKNQLSSIQTLITNIIFSDSITFESDITAVEITDYINQNLNENLTVDLICNRFYISKNRLYKLFHRFFNTTVNDYITDLRLSKAKKLLTETIEPVYKICDLTGIGNYTYFCKLFKKRFGITPTQYRNMNIKK